MWRNPFALPWMFAACLAVAAAHAQERMTVLVEFDGAKTGPNAACDGQWRLSAGDLRVRPWLDEAGDTVEGRQYRLTTPHDEQSAKAAKVRVAYRSSLPKGLLLDIDAAGQAVLSAATKLGDFELPLERLTKGPPVQLLGGKVRLQRIPNATPLGSNQAEEEYPSVAVLPDGQAAVAYTAWDGKTDRVVVRIGDRVETLTESAGDAMEPRCAVDGEGRLWVVWAAGDGKQWDLYARRGDGKIVRLTKGRGNQFWPRLARDPAGSVWLAWQAVADDLHYEIMLGRLGPTGLVEVANVSQDPHDDWEPAVCATGDGRIVVAWDSYRNGSYDIYLREFRCEEGKLQALGLPRPVAASAQREAHASLAADAAGRVWLAWDVSMEDWGKHPEQRGTLHSYRRTDVACYSQGRLQRPAADFQTSLPRSMQKFVEYPQIAVDGRDRLWLVFRVENEVRGFYKSPQVKQNVQHYGMWHLFATQYDGRSWSEPILLDRSSGRQDMRVDVARSASGDLLVAYAADGRTRRLPYVPVDYDVLLASLGGFGRPAGEAALVDAADLGRVVPARPDPELAPLPRPWTVGGKTYRLLLGDTHRHTDISRCANGYDGSLQDAYRYALNASGLDWLAISDHDQDILKHRADRKPRPRQDYDWWRSQKYCDLYSIPGRFAALYGYEHGGSYQARGGHKNIVVTRRGLPVEEVDAPRELFTALADSGAIAIPHQLADGGSRTDWQRWDSRFERVGEIFQTRGSYEFEGCPRAAAIFTGGNSMWDALAKGIRIGIIASSDHGQTHQARAGVYVEDSPPSGDSRDWTRRQILEALRARRTFGATTAAAIQLSAADRPLGQELTLEGPPSLAIRVMATAPISRVEVVRNNRFVYSTEPKSMEASFQYTDIDLKPGESAYYYVRARIGPNDFAWSSPLWITRTR